MNPLTQNPDTALQIARRTIDDRVHDAQQRAQAHAVRAARRAARRQSRTAAATPARHTSFPLAAFRLLRPARRTN
jgi:hypothetical protein